MKKCCTLFALLFTVLLSQAQWSNTTNQFYDSLHMPVSLAIKDQLHPVVVKSYPDSGYFVIWEDYRNDGNVSDIYAQKYDKAGNHLWAQDGAPVITGADYQLLAPSSNADYRYYGHACTDSAGGFYVAWDDDNATNTHSTAGHRIGVQHMLANGSAVFAYPGYIVAQPDALLTYQCTYPQLIADGRKGFFVSYLQSGLGYTNLYVQCLRDEGGTMVSYGGGQMDFNGFTKLTLKPCGTGSDIDYSDAQVRDYSIYPDLQGGCSVVMSMTRNTGTNNRELTGYNRLCRVKKDSHVTTLKRTEDIALADTLTYFYKKDSVVTLYSFHSYYNKVFCGGSGVSYAYTDYYVQNFGNGYLDISNEVYGTEYAKGTVVATDGNINVNIIATGQRDLDTALQATSWYKHGYYRADEVYDSIPHQLASDYDHPYFAYRFSPEGKTLDKINYSDDTIMTKGVYDYDFALTSSANRVFASALFYDFPTYNTRYLKLQQMQVDRVTTDSFAVRLHTASKEGITIGREVSTGFTGTDISYDNPVITTDNRGNALFSITDIRRNARVSPIGDSAQLTWGPMGKLIGSGLYAGHYYNVAYPYVAMSPTDGTAVIAWTDDRYIAPNSTYNDIYMRHLDSLKIYDYLPPVRTLNTLSYGGNYLLPGVLFGTTGKWGTFEVLNGTTDVTTPVLALTDNYNLGSISGSVYEYTQSPIRNYNGAPYLSRNWVIKPENNPAGAATIGLRLYFTTAQFTQLQAADPTITSPGDLVVIKQPISPNGAPDQYTPVSGEELVAPTAWQSVDGGYSIEIPVSSFSSFFIKKNDGILPVTWLNINAQHAGKNEATVNWAVANETNVKNYTVQYSVDGITYKDGCSIVAAHPATYSCLVNINDEKAYYFRVVETDLTGRKNNSKTAWLDKLQQLARFIVSPNPVRQNATLVYTMPTAAAATLRLFNSAGITLWQQKLMLNTSGTVNVPMQRLPSGSYSLQVVTSQMVQTIKLIKEGN